jgi:gluconolactonase
MKYLLIGLLGLNSVFCQETLGELEFLDDKMHDFFSSDAKIEVLASGFKWAEGPVWVPELNGLFSQMCQTTRPFYGRKTVV